MYVHHSHTDGTLLSSLKTAELHSTRGTCNLNPAASRQFPMVLGDTAVATYAQISSLDVKPGLLVWKCSTDHCWKQRHTTDILCPACAAICQYVNPASHRPTMRPCSNGWIATTGVSCLGQFIAGRLSAPLWPFACENTYMPVLPPEGGYTVYWFDCLGSPYCDMCVSIGLNLLSCTPTMINYLIHQFAIQWTSLSHPFYTCLCFRLYFVRSP